METKPTIVFIHGMFCTGQMFDKYVDFFQKQGYSVIAITLPYHQNLITGSFDARLGRTGIEHYVQHVTEIIEQITGEYILIGHSMGGIITMVTTCQPQINPKMIALLAPAAPWGIFALKISVLRSFFRILLTHFWDRPIKLEFEDICYSMLNKLPENERQLIYNQMVWESGRAAMQMGFWVFDPHKTTKINPKDITCPVLIFIGTADRITPYSVVKDTAEFLRKKGYKDNVFIYPYENKGHWLLTELEPLEVLLIIEQFLHKRP